MEYALSNRHRLDASAPPIEQQLELLARSVKMLLGHDIVSPAPSTTAKPDEMMLFPGAALTRRPPWKKRPITLAGCRQ